MPRILLASLAGSWSVSDEGKYCIQIDWAREPEKWCAYLLKGPEGACCLNVADDAHRIVIAK